MCASILLIWMGIKKRIPSHIWLCFILGCLAVFIASEWMPWSSLYALCAPLHDFLKMVQYPYRYMSIVSALLVPAGVYAVKVAEACWSNRTASERSADKTQTTDKSLISDKAPIADKSPITDNAHISDNTSGKISPLYTIFIILALLSSLLLITKADNSGLDHSVSSYDESEFCMDHLYLMQGVEYSDLIDNNQFATVTSSQDISAGFCMALGSKKQITVENHGNDGYIVVPVWAYHNLLALDSCTKERFAVSKSDYNTLRIAIPANYSGTIDIVYREPLLWKICSLISLITFVLATIGAIKNTDISRVLG